MSEIKQFQTGILKNGSGFSYMLGLKTCVCPTRLGLLTCTAVMWCMLACCVALDHIPKTAAVTRPWRRVHLVSG